MKSVIYVVAGRARKGWGKNLEFMAGPGDFIHEPPYVPHQDINASGTEPRSRLLCRIGQPPMMVGLDISGVGKPKRAHWVHNIDLMFEQAFRNIDDILWKEAGCTTELDYTEQTSWLLFLKYLDGLEQDRAIEAKLEGKRYTFILDKPYRWESWAAPKDKAGKLDHNNALSGDDLRDFVNAKLFPYLHGFKQKASGPNTIEYKVGEIFGEIKNKITSGYNLREIIDHIDELRFRSQAEKHELSHLAVLW